MQQVIFDFDGTLVDSLPVALAIAREVVPEMELSNKQLQMLRQMPARDVIKQSGIPRWKQLRLLVKGKKLLAQHLDELHVFPGMAQAVADLSGAGYNLVLVSSNSEHNIRKVLRRHKIEQYFAGVYGNVGLFNKARIFKVALKKQRASADQAVYVGDEVRDIEAADTARIKVVAVTWGYNSEKILKAYRPDYLARTPQQLVRAIHKAQPL